MLTLFFYIPWLVTLSYAQIPNPPTRLDYRLEANLNYFSSSANYKPGGSSVSDLERGGSFSDLTTRLTYVQDLSRQERVYGGFSYSQTTSDDGLETRKNTNFSELHFGGQYWLYSDMYNLAPMAEFIYPLSRVSRSGDDVLLGEGAIQLQAGTWAFFPLGEWLPFGFLSYSYRDEGRAHLVHYSVGIERQFSSLSLQVEYRGYERLIANSDTDTRSQRETFLKRVDAGSYRFYSLNPSLSELATTASYAFGSITMSVGAVITVNGSSSAQGWTLLAGLSYSPGGLSGPTHRPERISPSEKSIKPKAPKKPGKSNIDELIDKTEQNLQNM